MDSDRRPRPGRLVRLIVCEAAIALAALVWHVAWQEPRTGDGGGTWSRVTASLGGTTSQGEHMQASMSYGRPWAFIVKVHLACPGFAPDDGLRLDWEQRVRGPRDTWGDHRLRTDDGDLIEWDNGWRGPATVRSAARFDEDSMRGTLWAEAPITSGGQSMTCRSGPVEFDLRRT
jgi:hypothetical protein